MAKDDRDIESTLRNAMVSEVGRERFDLWFGDGVQLRVNHQSMIVSASDQFTLDRIRSQFRDALAAVGERLTGQPLSVQFQRVARTEPPAATRKPPKRPEPADEPNRNSKARPSMARRFSKLDEFVIGQSNRVAFTASQMVAERPGSVSPMFVFGPTGTGKTHLLEGIWSAVRKRAGSCRALFLSAEQFTSMFLEALQGSGLPNFRHKYRHVDLLLIDDVHFFLGKRATLVELQHTIDALLRQRRQVVLAADRAPGELKGIGPELTARFSGGLVCGIEPPDVETRRAILEQLARRGTGRYPATVLDLIASELGGDARQLAGALNRLEATSRAFQRPITTDLARETLMDVFRATRPVVRLSDIDRAVCNVFGLEQSTLQSARKARTISQPRALAMWLARKYTRSAYSEIGTYFGRRSHSTVISAAKQVNRWVQQGVPIQMAYGQCGIDEAIRRVESHIRVG